MIFRFILFSFCFLSSSILSADVFIGTWEVISSDINQTLTPKKGATLQIKKQFAAPRKTTLIDGNKQCVFSDTIIVNNKKEIVLIACKNSKKWSTLHHGYIVDNTLEFVTYGKNDRQYWKAKRVTAVKKKLCVGPFKKKKCD